MLEKPQIIWYFAHLFVPLHPIYKNYIKESWMWKGLPQCD